VPNGLAFSEFRGYEGWQTVSVSHDDKVMAVILANPVMINAYKSGIPGNGKPFPDGSKMAKVHWNAKKLEALPCRSPPARGYLGMRPFVRRAIEMSHLKVAQLCDSHLKKNSRRHSVRQPFFTPPLADPRPITGCRGVGRPTE
jgi:hypothetical protein